MKTISSGVIHYIFLAPDVQMLLVETKNYKVRASIIIYKKTKLSGLEWEYKCSDFELAMDI